MSRNMNSFVIFAIGATIGSWITYKVTKAKYEQPEPEEDAGIEEDEPTEEEKHMTKAEYESITEQLGYATRSEEGEEMSEIEKPYIIDADEFGEYDYETCSLTYYADCVLEDEYGDLVEDADDLIGLDNLNIFEEDSLYVRNDRLHKDIEILRDYQKYSDLYYTEE